ncbi:MAG: glycoside hydrolase family 2 TIM barrel-domain containing protein, partial [Anaerolineae bacterium]|nr:glycoside hydrolase family 2 TIM barrel-domain containing protein [Anaerolineae bacterium]
NQIFLNNKPIYLRLVLDQGFYPDGIWTAPSDGSLKRDIELSLRAGFNGARLHQKVFEPRFHYWADKLGYLTWGESSSWGIDVKDEISARNFLSEWREIIIRDRNHPSIIAWTPFNETGDTGDGLQHNRLHQDAAQLTRNLDPTRPVNDASGYVHVDTDIWTVHTYQQNPQLLLQQLAPSPDEGVFRNFPDRETAYAGQPYIVDEYGGIKWIPSDDLVFAENSWGYGDDPQTLDEFYERLHALTDVVLSLDHITGFCYTQLTDIEQEQNGIYNYDRSEKFDMDRISTILGRSRL